MLNYAACAVARATRNLTDGLRWQKQDGYTGAVRFECVGSGRVLLRLWAGGGITVVRLPYPAARSWLLGATFPRRLQRPKLRVIARLRRCLRHLVLRLDLLDQRSLVRLGNVHRADVLDSLPVEADEAHHVTEVGNAGFHARNDAAPRGTRHREHPWRLSGGRNRGAGPGFDSVSAIEAGL